MVLQVVWSVGGGSGGVVGCGVGGIQGVGCVPKPTCNSLRSTISINGKRESRCEGFRRVEVIPATRQLSPVDLETNGALQNAIYLLPTPYLCDLDRKP